MNFTEGCEATGRQPGSAGSRRRRAPRPGPAALLLLLLSLLLPPAAAAPLPAAADSSGEAGLEEEAGARRALPDCESLAWLLHSRAARLQDEVGTGPRRGTCGLRPGLGRDGSSRYLSADVREVLRLREQHGDARPEQPQPAQGDGGGRLPARRL